MLSISKPSASATSVFLVHADKTAQSRLLSEAVASWLAKKDLSQIKVLSTIDKGGKDCIVILYKAKENSSEYEEKEALRTLGNQTFQALKKNQAKEVLIESELQEAESYAFMEGLALSNYSFDKYKVKKDKLIEKIHLAADVLSENLIDTLNHVIETVFYARNIVNEPLSGLNARQISDSAKNFAQKVGIKYKELSLAEMKKLGMGGVLGVNQGSLDDPTFTILEWKPKNHLNKKPLVLVGKGVVYDSGGYSIKTGDGMKDMKCDMGGAAAVFGGIYLAALENVPLHIVSLVPAVENRINEKAIVPGDILTMSDKSTVEVLNTDAEGRLILADALVYARKYAPELVFNFATLTGAAMKTFGYGAAAYMGTANADIKKIASDAAFNSFERIAELPLWEDYEEQLKSNVADIKNIGGPMSGAITAGKFLQHFVQYPWLHFDIAGPAFLNSPSSYRPTGGTGTGIRFLLEFFKSYIEYVKSR